MLIYLPIAEMAVPVEMILLLSAAVGFLSGLFGIGGGFLMTPFLIFSGIPPTIAVGTLSAQLVASSMSGVLGHLRRGNVDVRIGSFMLAGGLAGTLIGILVFKFLSYIGQIDLAIQILYILVLGFIGSLMLFESFRALFIKRLGVRSDFNAFRISPFIDSLPYKRHFERSNLYISALVPIGIGFLGGLLASILGIGGGFILVPAMIYILGMPTLLVTGTSLYQMIFTTSFATLLHATANQTVDIVLAAVLIAGSVAGTQFGVVFSGRINGLAARVVLALIVLAVCFQLTGQLFIEPAERFSTVATG